MSVPLEILISQQVFNFISSFVLHFKKQEADFKDYFPSLDICFLEPFSSRYRCWRSVCADKGKRHECPKQWNTASVLGKKLLHYQSRRSSYNCFLQLSRLRENIKLQPQMVLLVQGEDFNVLCCPWICTGFRTAARVLCSPFFSCSTNSFCHLQASSALALQHSKL